MHISIAEKRENWNAFVLRYSQGEFLQSWEWGDFQKSYGRNVWRFIVKRHEETLAVATTICMKLPGDRCYIYIPRGPIWKKDIPKNHAEDLYSLLTQNWRLVALESRAFFIRVEPGKKFLYQKKQTEHGVADFLLKHKWRQVKSIQPQYTLAVPLNQTGETLLNNMHHKTRYNIRLAQKKKLSLRHINSRGGLGLFWDLLQITAKRDKISMYNFKYYRKLYNILGNGTGPLAKRQAALKMFGVFKEKEPLAAALIILFGDTAYYLYGASANHHRNMMPTYLMHWEIMKWAKSQGYNYYDLWGIMPPSAPSSHPWMGLTKFKLGFGGDIYQYPGAFDLPYNRLLYNVFRSAKFITRRR